MKDALGHGSNASNGQAARALASGPKSAPVPIHSAWRDFFHGTTLPGKELNSGGGFGTPALGNFGSLGDFDFPV